VHSGRVRQNVLRRPADFELQSGEDLSQLVVDLAGDALALLLAGGLVPDTC